MKTLSYSEFCEGDEMLCACAQIPVDKAVGDDTPFTVAEYLAEQGVEDADGTLAMRVDIIAARLYKEKYGVDPPVENSEHVAERRKLKEERELA